MVTFNVLQKSASRIRFPVKGCPKISTNEALIPNILVFSVLDLSERPKGVYNNTPDNLHHNHH